jgi:hypothetical protein
LEAIIIDKKKFEREFEITRNKLKLELLDAQKDLPHRMEETSRLQDLHRKFNYEICQLEDQLREG